MLLPFLGLFSNFIGNQRRFLEDVTKHLRLLFSGKYGVDGLRRQLSIGSLCLRRKSPFLTTRKTVYIISDLSVCLYFGEFVESPTIVLTNTDYDRTHVQPENRMSPVQS